VSSHRTMTCVRAAFACTVTVAITLMRSPLVRLPKGELIVISTTPPSFKTLVFGWCLSSTQAA
jgi:hypothetical protein